MWGIGIATLSASAGSSLQLETVGGQVLQRLTTPVNLPLGAESAAVRFEIEFATSELPIDSQLLDAATVSIRSADRRYAATLATVDAFGPLWLPFTPGATPVEAGDFVFAAETGLPPQGFLSLTRSFGVLELPLPFTPDPMTLVLTLFNNQDTSASRVVLKNIRVVSSLYTPIAVESSASLTGPFSLEVGTQDNRASRTVRVPRPPVSRFFKLEGDATSRITRFDQDGEEWVMTYTAELGTPQVRLEGSNDGLVFQSVNNAVLDLALRTFRVPLFRSFAFFRIVGSHPGRIVGDEVTGENRVIKFELAPPLPRVLGAANPTGPFALESGVTGDPFSQKLRLPKDGAFRYFRLRSSMGLRVVSIVPEAEAWVIGYEEL